MKPKNGRENIGSAVSSDFIIWQGPDIPCINLCHGDSITKVVHKLATKLCSLLDSLDVSNFDLSCLNLTGCAPETFEQLVQTLIDAICAANANVAEDGTDGNNGNYIVAFTEAPGANCQYGGTRFETRDGVTNLTIDTNYACNGAPGVDGNQGPQGPVGIGKKGDSGANGLNGAPSSITFNQEDNCEIVITQQEGSPDYIFSVALQDSGWVDLSGFDHYGIAVEKPKVRKIGRQLHFRVNLVIPLSSDSGATLIPLTNSNSYDNQAYNQVYTGIGGVVVNSNGSLTMNGGASVIPGSLDLCGKSIDTTYQKQYIASRQILVSGSFEGVSLSSVLQLNITTTGTMVIQTLLDIEQSSLGGSSFKGGSALRLITSKVVAGDQVPDYTDTQTMIHHNSSTGVQSLEADFQGRTYTFDCDAGQPEQIGGFVIKLDGLTAFLGV